MDRIQAKDERGEKAGQAVLQETNGQVVNKSRDPHMRENCAKMPSPRFRSEGDILKPKPKKKKRTVEVAWEGRMHERPHVGGEVTGQKTPGSEPGVLHDLEPVVEDELKPEGVEVSHKNQDKNHDQAESGSPFRQRLRAESRRTNPNFVPTRVRCEISTFHVFPAPSRYADLLPWATSFGSQFSWPYLACSGVNMTRPGLPPHNLAWRLAACVLWKPFPFSLAGANGLLPAVMIPSIILIKTALS